MFRRLPDFAAAAVEVYIDGEPYTARAGDTVAAALLASGRLATRSTPISGAGRGPFCMMGVCFECRVVVDGRSSDPGCQILVAPGMRIDTQAGGHLFAATNPAEAR